MTEYVGYNKFQTLEAGLSKQESSASMSARGVPIKHKRQDVSGKAFSFAKYLLATLDRVSLTYLWQREKLLMIDLLDHKRFSSMTNWGCCLDYGEGVDYKLRNTRKISKMPVRQVKIVMGWEWSHSPQRQSSRRSDRQPARTASVRFRTAISPTLFEDDWLPVRDCHVPLTVSFLSCHALLTENKDTANRTGQGFMVWGEALLHYREIKNGLKHQTALSYNRSRWNIKCHYKGKLTDGWTCFRCWACALCDHPWQMKQVVPCLPLLK